MCLTALPLPCPAGKLSTMQGKHDAEMAVLKSKITALQAEKSKLTDKMDRLQDDKITARTAAAKDKESAVNSLQAGHALALCEQFKEGAKFAQGIMQK